MKEIVIKNQNNESDVKENETLLSQQKILKELSSIKLEYQNLHARHTALFKLNQLSHECEHLDKFYHEVHQVIASLMIAKNFYIVLYDQTLETLEFVYHQDEQDSWPQGAFSYDEFKGSLTRYIIETAKPLLVDEEKIKVLENSGLVKSIGVSGTDWLGVPLINDGFVIGVMAVQSYNQTIRYEEPDLELLSYAAQHIVNVMTRLQDHERLHAAVSARTHELMQQIREREKSELLQESLFRISELTTDANIDIEKFYKQVHNIVGQLLNAENFFIAKYDVESNVISFVYFSDQSSENADKNYIPRQFGKGFTELVIKRANTVLLTQDDIQELHLAGEIENCTSDVKSWLGVPLKSAGITIGAMVVHSYQNVTVYAQQDAELLNFVSQHVSTAIKRRELIDYERRAHELLEQQVKLRTAALEDEIKQRKQVEQQLKYAASHDSLTELPNRMVFIDLLDHAIAYRKRHKEYKFAILFLDLDRFKVVNDSLGHHAGDLLLQVIAKELCAATRNMDTVARLGGDEFVILVEDLVADDEVIDIAERITDLLTTPFNIDNQPVFIGTSIGVLFSDDRYDNANTMLRDADTAMYHAKYNGKGRYEVFDASMHDKVQNSLMLEADLREAIELEEFEPFFQPIIKLSTGQVAGFEALARWQSHKRGFVYPDNFIPLAEETNLVMAIDLQILEKSCVQLKHWQEKLNRDDLYISCNLFCKHFFSNTLPEDISKILKRVGVKPEQIRVELTERALLEHTEIVLTNMQGLKQLGIKILLDDFGTGYSSLSYLHRFPIDVLKIDRSFINNVHDSASHRAIIKTIIDLATNLNMSTIGEGIENMEDATLLHQMECNYGQGYFFAKPMTAEQASNYLIKQNNVIS
ncbi:MAG: bifunctional diguanylate cyclase/phosphodiesterase [Gammaproteobacteria bacterium]|nr:MAG: bifunctional diguanylate cyclase/phosphodiesterase [Gammaproteobacteria bacterium]